MKLPKGMFRRGRSFYVRLFAGGQDRWIGLGRDLVGARERLAKLRAGEPIKPRITMADASERWLEHYVRTARNPKGQRLARSRVRRYLVPLLGGKLLGEVNPDDLRAYRVALERRDLAPQTVAHILTDVRSLF